MVERRDPQPRRPATSSPFDPDDRMLASRRGARSTRCAALRRRRAGGASSRAAFSSVSAHSAAGSESATIPPPTPNVVRRRRIVNVRIATARSARSRVGVDPADRAAVDAAAHRLEVLDRLHHPRLRRAGDRRGRERGVHQLAEPDVVRDGGRARCSRGGTSPGCGSSRAELGRPRSSPDSHTRPRSLRARSTIITFSARSFSLARSVAGVASPVPLIGRVSTVARRRRARKRSGDAETTVGESPATGAGPDSTACGAGLPACERVEQRDRVGGRPVEPAREVHLVALAGADQLLDRARTRRS